MCILPVNVHSIIFVGVTPLGTYKILINNLVSVTPLKLMIHEYDFHEIWYFGRTSYVVMHIAIKVWFLNYCASYSTWNLKIILNELISAASLKLLIQSSGNLVYRGDIACSFAYPYENVFLYFFINSYAFYRKTCLCLKKQTLN